MIKHFFILSLLFSFGVYFISASASTFSLKGPIRWIWAPEIAPNSINPSQEECFAGYPLLPSLDRKSKSQVESLDDKILHIILEYFIDDYATMRQVSKSFRRAFDDLIYATCWMKFPCFTKDTFSFWNDQEPTMKKKYMKYQLIPLLRVVSFYAKPLIDFHEKSETRLDLTTNDQLRRNAVRLIRLIHSEFLNGCLELTNVFLKLRIVAWDDIYHLLFSNNSSNVSRAWSLGLMTIARDMSTFHENHFIRSTASEEGKGLLEAIKSRNYILSRFIIRFLHRRSHKFKRCDGQYLNNVFAQLVNAMYWDLLQDMYELSKVYLSDEHVMGLAEFGYVEGLRALRGLTRYQRSEMAYRAASEGQLEFLKELDALRYLGNFCFLAIHHAALNGHKECLEFLVSRLGIKYLGFKDGNGFMPIFYAASRSRNYETLRAVLRLYPYYKTNFFGSGIVSPLREALLHKASDNARILINYFPELVNTFDYINHTPIHMAISGVDADVLKLLLYYATPEVITARDYLGNTALHLACQYKDNLERIEILMRTDFFNPMERNNLGSTPVALFTENNRSTSKPSDLMRIFRLHSDEPLREALSEKN